MSVQAGVWNFDGKPMDSKLMSDFSDMLKESGPDGEATYMNGNIAMVYRPFHTTAESRREKQPYISHRRLILTWDGRLDNRDDLITHLCNELDSEPTDIEIVGAAFDRWETECFRRIIGDWAVSIWNPHERELIFATDFMAIRHIFYYIKQDQVWWSTDLASLVLLSSDKFHIDDEYVAGYLAHDPDAHLTPYRDLRQVPPGQFVRIRNRHVSIERHWRFSPKSRIRYKTDAEYEEHFRHVFRQSVRRRLGSDSPVLAELSGGLDSSSIVCVADDILVKEKQCAPRLDTLSYYDQMEPDGDDRLFFRKIEQNRGREGYHIDASSYGGQTVLKSGIFLPLPGHLPFGCQLEVERARAIREGAYRAVLSGVGGDEFMGGIPNPSAYLADLIVRGQLLKFAKQTMAWSKVKRKPLMQLLWQSCMELIPSRIRQHLKRKTELEAWIGRDFAATTNMFSRRMDAGESFGLCLPTRRLYLGGVILMSKKMAKQERPRLALEERRYPYLDEDLLTFILSIPPSQLLRPGERRSLMRRALVGIVPTEVLSRRTKGSSARTPMIALEQNWEELHALFARSISSMLGYIDRPSFCKSLKAARAGKAVPLMPLLRVISLEVWLQEIVSRGLISEPTENWLSE